MFIKHCLISFSVELGNFKYGQYIWNHSAFQAVLPNKFPSARGSQRLRELHQSNRILALQQSFNVQKVLAGNKVPDRARIPAQKRILPAWWLRRWIFPRFPPRSLFAWWRHNRRRRRGFLSCTKEALKLKKTKSRLSSEKMQKIWRRRSESLSEEKQEVIQRIIKQELGKYIYIYENNLIFETFFSWNFFSLALISALFLIKLCCRRNSYLYLKFIIFSLG